ncbi:hypothetical protein [Enterobacter sp. R1(2018)]|uniref:hypothetical protein n=1 Tax=Enterobacter sp. R1(2018) TaxID=2447891 RepID=UPI000EAD2E13|nr:hypothetical protein [Enterobacter sp. R1(2018)]RKQ39184.1 hypothetical protein D8M09_12805 [Enterobacter sp. R1(2018)]
MLPNSFMPWRFQSFSVKDDSDSAKNSEVNAHAQQTFSALEKTILSGNYYAGVAKNTLLEETDRHIKERLLCAIKIETLVAVINELCEQEKLNPADLQMLVEDKTSDIRLKEEQIWLNQLTQEKNWPLFYSFEE